MLIRPAVLAVWATLTLWLAAPYALAEDQSTDFGNLRHDVAGADVTVQARGSERSTPTAAAHRPSTFVCSRDDGLQVPCSTQYGWWSAAYDCYLSVVEADSTDPATLGETKYRCHPGDLGWVAGGGTEVFVWLPPQEVGPDPEVLAMQATDSMHLAGPHIATAPPSGTAALVNAPVWLWASDPGPTTWGPITASAQAGGVTVTATAKAQQIVWDTGDGDQVTCGTGTAYSAEATTDCSHTYRQPGQLALTATTTWLVDWRSTTGPTGHLPITTVSSTTINVREARAYLTQRG